MVLHTTWLYKTYSTLASGSWFSNDVEITDDRVLVSAPDDDYGGSIFIYSAVTGNSIEKRVALDTQPEDNSFGDSVCASNFYYMVGTSGAGGNGDKTGTAYL
eukprot:CAMPEP_0178973056 /NCGR_PEP_ID=MMETSP0789-20121207/21470_1 /TAXON_ID=3005 /ORGANISM="Rhizosolenia setigera, Strain CCMP 1694" /LENGTH=101 /DNA_ID=CAMNT_0020660799 /DNA_START=380 /DNA_END=685 /DNA_ORIENTATION=-